MARRRRAGALESGDIFAADRPTQVRSETIPAIGAAAPQVLFWRVERASAQGLDVELPHDRGSYVLSVLEIFDDGGVAAGRATVTVR